MHNPSKITLLIPCLNEEEVLPSLFSRILSVTQRLEEDWEVIFIDDGSTDRTLSLLQAKQKEDARFKAISFSRNFGHQAAVSAGLEYAKGDAVFILDADLQDPPELLPAFLEKWRQGYEVVYGVRKNRKEGIILRFLYALFYRMMNRIVSFEVPLDSGDFCLMDRKIVDLLVSMPERNRFVRGLRAWTGFRQTGLEYNREARAAGKPKYNLKRLIKLAVDGMFSFSGFPLRLAAIVGIYISTFSMLGVLFTLLQRIFRPFFAAIGWAPVPGFATIVIAILFLGGIQLIFLGVIGEYLYRIFEEVKRRPRWIIREEVGTSRS